MKEIKMDYSEYEDMLHTLEMQSLAINEMAKDSRVILIDIRQSRVTWRGFHVPKIIGDEKLAKEYLKEDLDDLERRYLDLINRMDECENNKNINWIQRLFGIKYKK